MASIFDLNELRNDEKNDLRNSGKKEAPRKDTLERLTDKSRERVTSSKIDGLNKGLEEYQFLKDDKRDIETARGGDQVRNSDKKDPPRKDTFEKDTYKSTERDRAEIVRELEKEHKPKESEKVYVYKNDRKNLQQKIVERRSEKQSLNEYKQHIRDYNNGFTSNQRAYHYQKAMKYEERQQQKSHWESINKQEYRMLRLNEYDKHIWNAAQDNRGLITQKSLNRYAEKTFEDKVDKEEFLNYCDMKLTKYTRIGMINDKSQTALQRADAFGLVTNKTHTDYDTRIVYFNDKRIDVRINEIESHIKDKGLLERFKFEFASVPQRDVQAQKDRIELNLKEEKSAGKDYKDLYKDFLSNKDRNLADMPKDQIKAEYDALKKLKEESAKTIKVRKNYKYELNQRFLNKVEEYETAKLERDEKKIEKHRDDIKYSPLSVFDKEIVIYMDKSGGVLDNKIFDKMIESEGRTRETITPELEQRVNLLKTRILDLKAAGCLRERRFNQNSEGFEYIMSSGNNLRDSEKNLGSELDKQIHNYCEKHDKTFNIKEFEKEIRENHKELSEVEINEKITISQLRVTQLYANDYFYKITEEIYISKESFDYAMRLNEEYIKFQEGNSSDFLNITKESEKINNLGCKLDKEILGNALNNNGIIDIACITTDAKKAKIIDGRVKKLVKFGYVTKSDSDKYCINDTFEKEIKEKSDIDFEKFEFRFSDSKYLKVCKEQMDSKGYFNLEEYNIEKYGKADVKESELDKNDKFMFKRLKTMEGTGLLKNNEKGNITITERGIEKERAYIRNKQQESIIEHYNKFEFTEHDHNKWFATIRNEIKGKGKFNSDLYMIEKYGTSDVIKENMSKSDMFMFTRINTMLAAGIIVKDENGNINISERGLMVEKAFFEGIKKPIIEAPKALEKPKEEVKFTSFDYSNIAIAVDSNGIFSKETFVEYFKVNNYVGAVGQSYLWTKEQAESKYYSATKRLDTFIENNISCVQKLNDGTYKLDQSYIDRAIVEFEKNSLKGKERSVRLNREQNVTVSDIASYGQLLPSQIIWHVYGGKDDLYKIDLSDLKRKGLVVTEKYDLKGMGEQTVIALTPRGRAIAEINTGKDRIATKSKLNKEGELAHDLYIYDTVKHLESQLAKEGKKIEITYSDRQMKSIQQGILAREYNNHGLGVATLHILDKASEAAEISKEAYEYEVRNQYTKEGFINKKLKSFDKTFEALESKDFIKKVDGKYMLTDKGERLRSDINTGRLQIMFSDCQVVISDEETGEISTINIEVDLSYTDDEIREKAANVPNQLWATNSEKQKTKIQKYVSRSVFLLR